MRIATLRAGEELRPAIIAGDRVVDLLDASRSHVVGRGPLALPVPQSIEALLAQGSEGLAQAERVAEWALERGDHGLDLASARFAPPVTRPQKIIGVGMNYRDHCAELNRPVPEDIRTFGMFANTLVGHEEAVILPRESAMMDYEAELVIVIGKPGKHLLPEEALDFVAGYANGNDVSARDFQLADPQAMRGKSGDTHSPLGPWIVTADELPPGAHGLEMETRVNGELRQKSSTSDMIFGVAEIVSFLSRYFRLLPGDLIFTGTPAGVQFGKKEPIWLKPGDRVDIEFQGLGRLSNSFVAEN
jgi:2-keto-4-pentenoate hydratase/2-oxohepta-3-ene-1,7-dioic acid hydratase in catechol pathway